MLKLIRYMLGVFCLAALIPVGQAQLRVFACEPEWAALTRELAADKANIYQATTAFQDPHHIEARPSLIAKMRRADLLVCTGAGLEAGWLPLLLRQAANDKVLPGNNGYFEAALQVELLDIPQSVDRSHGDVHPEGNPHIHLDPRRLLKIAKALKDRLVLLDPTNQVFYQQRFDSFEKRWQAAILGWQHKARALHNFDVATYHKDWRYLFDWLGMNMVANLEPKPGIAPSAGYLAELKQTLKHKPAKMVIYASYQNNKAASWLSREMNYPLVELPYTVGGNKQAQSLTSLFDDTIDRLLGALEKKLGTAE